MFFTFALCVSVGSVSIPIRDTATIILNSIRGIPIPDTIAMPSIILDIRLPRVICVALTGASLSICGGAMQGLLRNPLADGSTPWCVLRCVTGGGSCNCLWHKDTFFSFHRYHGNGHTICFIIPYYNSYTFVQDGLLSVNPYHYPYWCDIFHVCI